MDAKKILVTHNAIQDQISKIDNKIQKAKIIPLSNHTLPLSTSNTLQEMQNNDGSINQYSSNENGMLRYQNIIVTLLAKKVLTTDECLTYPLNDHVSLNIKISNDKNDLNISDERTKAALIIQRFWKHRIVHKFGKLIKLLQEKQVKRFARICWTMMLVLLVGGDVTSHASNWRYNISVVTTSFAFFLILLIYARSLTLDGEKMKRYTMTSLGIYYLCLLSPLPFIISFIIHGNGDWTFFLAMIVLGIVSGILMYIVYLVFNILGSILQYENKHNLSQLSLTVTGRLFATLPVMCILAMQSLGSILVHRTLYGNMCRLLHNGTIPPSATNPSWGNCPDDPPVLNKYYPKDPVTVHEMKLQRAIEVLSTHNGRHWFMLYQVFEPMILMITSLVLFRVCRLTVRDILALRTSIRELIVVFVTLLYLLVIFLGGSVGMSPGFSTPVEYQSFINPLFTFWIILIIIRIITMLMLIKNGQKCMNMELNGEDPSNYSHGVRIINRRGIKLKDASSKQEKKHN